MSAIFARKYSCSAPATALLADDMEVPGNTFQTELRCGNLLIRPELSPSQGIRSLANCLLLARCWPIGNQVRFVLSPNAPSLAEKRIVDAGFATMRLPAERCATEELSQLKDCIAKWHPTALILDGHRFAALQPGILSVLPTQVICLQHAGIAYRPEFHIQSNVGVESEKKITSRVRRLTVMIHGSDQQLTTEGILTALDKISTPSLSIDVCVDPLHGRTSQLRELSSTHRHSVRIHKSISGVEAMIPGADLGIANVGTRCFDLAFHGVPMLVIGSNNATREMGPIREVTRVMENIDSTANEDRLFKAISSLIRDRERRRQLSTTARRLVDGRGANRITELLIRNLTPLRKAS